MADPTGLDELEAELRRMEEELAALQGAKKEKKAKKAKPEPAPVEAVAEAPPAEPKKRFALPKLGRKKDEAPVLATETGAPEPAAAPLADDTPPAARVEPPPVAGVSGRWSREGAAWVLTVPRGEPTVVRRVLDRDGNVIEEVAASAEMLASPRPVPVEIGEPMEAPAEDRPLHTLAEKLGGKKKRGLFGRKKE